MKWILILTMGMTTLFGGFDATIPVLDMDEYHSAETKEKFLSELHTALAEVGFFAVVNTGVDVDMLDEAYQACADFFSLPLEEKLEVNDPTPMGREAMFPANLPKAKV